MAILAIFTGNVTKEQYQKLRSEVKWETRLAEGGIFHCVGFDEDGKIHVADVWESAEQMNTFVERRLVPAFKKLEISPPDVVVFPVHNINAYPAIDRFKI